MIQPPTLTTERLTLRPYEAGDFDDYAALMMSDRARYMDGPFDLKGAWFNFASDIAQWALYGWGALAVTRTDTAAVVGQVGINRIPFFPEPEIGWIAYEAHEGKGFISEAAVAFRDWCWSTQDFKTLVSYIDAENVRSIALAERLGAVRDDAAPRPEGDDCVVYRHPVPEARP